MTEEGRSLTALTGRTENGKFASGEGNTGRPIGSRNKVSLQAISKIRELTDDAFLALKENVTARDQRAVEYVLNRVIPSGRLIELEASSPNAVADALVSGQISPEEAKQISSTLSKLQEMQDLDAVKERMTEIENLLHGN